MNGIEWGERNSMMGVSVFTSALCTTKGVMVYIHSKEMRNYMCTINGDKSFVKGGCGGHGGLMYGY